MKQEEKQLLLKDLCARLPYHVMVEYRCANIDLTKHSRSVKIENCKPYLRPMSSMTEEEIFEFMWISDSVLRIGERKSTCILSLEQIDWLNGHHFDYRNLIEKGLALEALKNMYKTG